MDRKLHKNELALWKEVTKEDIKINDYISEEMMKKKIVLLKKDYDFKKKLNINIEKNDLVVEETAFKENKLQR